LAFHCRLRGLPEERARQVLAAVGLLDAAHTRLSQLSSSQIRRLDFGRALLHDPRVLLLVEPFSRCDETTITLLSALIRQQASAQSAVLCLASDATHLLNLADALYELNQGRISELNQQRLEPAERLPFKIPVRYDDKVVLFNPADILYASAEAGRAIIFTDNNQIPTQYTLAELEERLARSGFFRAHRSYLVNLQHVREVIPYTRNSFTLRLNDQKQTEIPLSKSAASELKDLLNY
jgi:ABC-2 type transport system ATP-binding protein